MYSKLPQKLQNMGWIPNRIKNSLSSQQRMVFKNKNFSLSQKLLVFIKIKYPWNNQLVFNIAWIMFAFLVSLENQVVEKL